MSRSNRRLQVKAVLKISAIAWGFLEMNELDPKKREKTRISFKYKRLDGTPFSLVFCPADTLAPFANSKCVFCILPVQNHPFIYRRLRPTTRWYHCFRTAMEPELIAMNLNRSLWYRTVLLCHFWLVGWNTCLGRNHHFMHHLHASTNLTASMQQKALRNATLE